ncbi:MAG: RNA 2',3'-cyclic phosphodiesterase [Candidatus Diapherotrites archaeon]
MKRLFIALPIPARIRQELASRYSSLLCKPSFKPVEEKNLHLTLQFLGNIPESEIPSLAEKLGALESFPSFELELEGVGHFGHRVVFVNIGKGREKVEQLQRSIAQALGLEQEKTPHLTLARAKEAGKKEVEEALSALSRSALHFSFPVNSVVLYSSVLSPEGPSYFSEKIFHLNPRAGASL